MLLISQGLEINAPDNEGVSPLHLASERGNIMVVKSLVEHGANIQAVDNLGRLPLHMAASRGHWGPAQLFILRGVNVNPPDSRKSLPVHYAAESGQQRMVKLLLGRGADYLALNGEGKTPLNLAEERLAGDRLAVGLTPLQVSQRQGRENTVNFLRAVIIDEYAAAVERSDTEFLASLTRVYPLFVNSKTGGRTPLWRAARAGRTALVELLLAHGAQPGIQDDSFQGLTPLHAAALGGHAEVAKQLMAAGLAADTPNALGVAAAATARESGHEEFATLLEKPGA